VVEPVIVSVWSASSVSSAKALPTKSQVDHQVSAPPASPGIAADGQNQHDDENHHKQVACEVERPAAEEEKQQQKDE
jgi:hypothetical protein